MFTSKTLILTLATLTAVAQNQNPKITPDCVIPLKCDFSNPTKAELKAIRSLKDTEVILVRKSSGHTADSLRGHFAIMGDNSIGFSKSKGSKEGWEIILFNEPNGPDDYILLRMACVDSRAVE